MCLEHLYWFTGGQNLVMQSPFSNKELNSLCNSFDRVPHGMQAVSPYDSAADWELQLLPVPDITKQNYTAYC